MPTRVYKVWHNNKFVIETNSPTFLLSYLRSICLANGLDISEVDGVLVNGILQSDLMVALDCEVHSYEITEE